MHVSEDIMDDQGKIDQHKIDLVARCGQNWYCRASGPALFEVEKPNLKMGIGIDQLPSHIRNSEVLSGNDLGQLGNLQMLPDENAVSDFRLMPEIKEFLYNLESTPDSRDLVFHLAAKELIKAGKAEDALKLLMLK